MKVSNDWPAVVTLSCGSLAVGVQHAHQSADSVCKAHDEVDESIIARHIDAVIGEEAVLDVVEVVPSLPMFDEQGARPAWHHPSTMMHDEALRAQFIERAGEPAACLHVFKLNLCLAAFPGADQAVSLAPALCHEWRFAANDLINAADLIANFGGNFKQ